MSVEQNLWSLRLPNGDVRSGTIEQLEEAFRAGHINGKSPVLPPGAREWITLDSIPGRGRPGSVAPPPVAVAPVTMPPPAAVARPLTAPPPAVSRPPAASVSATDIWQVRLPNGELRSGTRQQLEEAFQAGHLGGSLLALPAGAHEWKTLESVLQRPSALSVQPSALPPTAAVAAEPPPPSVTAPQPAVEADAPATSPAPPPSKPAERDDDLWQVKITRRQLEEAFRAGYLDESVLVLPSGAVDWVKLSSFVDPSSVESPPSTPSAASHTGEWPPTEPAHSHAFDDSLTQRTENGGRAQPAKVSDDETPSAPGLA